MRGFFIASPMTLAAKPFAAAVNHLLARESWARDRLIPYAGKTARLEISPVTLVLLVQPDGYLAAVEAHDARRFDVSIALSRASVPEFAAICRKLENLAGVLECRPDIQIRSPA